MGDRRQVAGLLVAGTILMGCGASGTGDEASSAPSTDGTVVPTTEHPSAWVLGYSDAAPAAQMSVDQEPREVWSRDVGEMVDHHVVLDDQLVYLTRTGTDTFDLVAVALADGEERWRTSLPGEVWPSSRQEAPSEGGDGSEYLVPVGDLILVHGYDEGRRAIDPDSGQLVWELDPADSPFVETMGRGSETCLTHTEEGPTGEGGTVCVRSSDGERSWWAPGFKAGSSESTAYLRTDAGIVAVDLATGDERWQVLGAEGSVVEVNDTAVICDSTISGVDATGLRQWDLESEGVPTCWPSGHHLLVKDAETLRLLHPRGGEVVAERTLDGWFQPSAVLDEAILGQSSEGWAALEIHDGEMTPMADVVERHVVSDGTVALANAAELDGPGPGSWSISGGAPGESGWSVEVGWTRPALEATDSGLLMIDLGHGGNLWFGAVDGPGPDLSAVVSRLGAPSVPPTDLILDGQSALGVPFGTPLPEARAVFIEELGLPSSWNEHSRPDGQPRLCLMWGTLEIVAEAAPGETPRLTGWRDNGRGWSSGFLIVGAVTPWSTGEELRAAGYADADTNQLCQDEICFRSFYGQGDEVPRDSVEAPGSEP